MMLRPFNLWCTVICTILVPLYAHALEIKVDDRNSTFFSFTGFWNNEVCGDCVARPDTSRAFNMTWMDSGSNKSPQPRGEITFRGSAISIYGVNLNKVLPQGALAVQIDGQSVAVSEPANDGSTELTYDSPLFRADNLSSDQPHTLSFTIVDSAFGGQTVIVDYAIITLPDESKTTSLSSTPTFSPSSKPASSDSPKASPKGAVLPAVAGGLAGLVALVVAGVCLMVYRRRTTAMHKRTHFSLDLTAGGEPSTQNYQPDASNSLPIPKQPLSMSVPRIEKGSPIYRLAPTEGPSSSTSNFKRMQMMRDIEAQSPDERRKTGPPPYSTRIASGDNSGFYPWMAGGQFNSEKPS